MIFAEVRGNRFWGVGEERKEESFGTEPETSKSL